MTPYQAGQAAARDGLPHTDCPIQKPDMPATGEHYPGDWANWMRGWINERSIRQQDCVEACRGVCEFLDPLIAMNRAKR